MSSTYKHKSYDQNLKELSSNTQRLTKEVDKMHAYLESNKQTSPKTIAQTLEYLRGINTVTQQIIGDTDQLNRNILERICDYALVPTNISDNLESLTTINLEKYLTPRELEILAKVHEEYTNKQIADELGIEEATVKNHMSLIFTKLNVHNRRQAAEKYHHYKSSKS